MTTNRAVVLYGGPSNERAVSVRTGEALASALEEAGVSVDRVELSAESIRQLATATVDAVMLATHGAPGEDGTVQGLLELLGVPYTGSGVLASALAMDKVRTKHVLRSHGIPTPEWVTVESGAVPVPALGFPCVVKPSLEGSSVGVAIVRSEAEWASALATCSEGRGETLVEAFVRGRELTVALFDEEELGICEIAAADGFYDYAAKYERGDTSYLIPAPLSITDTQNVSKVARTAYDALGCRGVARVDVMLAEDGTPFVLEVNTIPGMTESSLVPKLALHQGYTFSEFAMKMLRSARLDVKGKR